MTGTSPGHRTVVTPQGRRTLWLLLLSAAAAAAAVLSVGWFTGFRQLAQVAMISVAVFAFLPFVIVATGLLLAATLFFLSILASLDGTSGGDGGAGDVAEASFRVGFRTAPGYYRWLASRRHPIFWGVPLGVLLGGLSLWALLAALVLPGEARTAEAIADARAAIDAHYKSAGRYPRPTAGGHVTWAALGLPHRGDTVTDGFGRPLEYRVEGAWKVASYRLRSPGYDGRQGGGDDFCTSGTTPLGKLLSAVTVRRDGRRWTVTERLGAIRELRCKDEAP
jgi:hypothetical protein